MSIFIMPDEEDTNTKINIDDLYEKKQRRDLKQISIFNKILGRIHKRIQYTARQKKHTENFIWFAVPEYIVGEPIYDKGECMGYLVSQLEKNGFHIKYVHPNTLFISWHNWVPSYVRNEIKKKMGIVIDERGNVVKKEAEIEEKQPDNQKRPKEKQFNSTKNYKPTGNLLYDKELFEKIEKKVSFV